jgi:flagellar M-ring protein FliF
MADEDQTLMERFGGFSRQPAVRQLALLVGLAASVALAIGLVQWATAPGMKPLFSQLNPADTNIVISTLESNGIEYEINAGGSMVAVPKADLDRARLLLASEGLPKGDGIGFESLYQEQELGLSSFMEQARYHRALEAELARTMAALDSVRSARVHLAISKESPFLRKGNAPAASVMLNIYPGRILSDRQLAGIVHLVSSSVPNLDASQVSVVDQAGKLLSDQGEDDAMGSSKDHYRLTQQLEQDYSDRIVMILEPILGAGSVRAQVNADMDFTRIERTSEVYAPDTVVRSEQLSEEIANTPVDGGAPGELVNEPPVDPAVQDQPVEGQQVAQQAPARTSTSTTRNYEMDKTISHIQETPGSLRRLSVAVLLDYAENVGEDGQVTRAPLEQAQLDEIRTLVSEAIGFTADRGDTLSIMNAEFMRPPAPEPLPEPGFLEQDWVWQAGKGLLALSVLLALVFAVLRPLMRFAAVPIPPAPQMVPQNQLAGPDGQAGGQMMLASGEPVGLPQNMNQGANYLQSLSMARQAAGGEPARAASVMKNWVAADG